MSQIRVGVLRGGPSREYDVSLRTGSAVLNNLDKDKYNAHDCLIDRNGKWFIDGKETNPEYLSRHTDVIFNALHGQYGEDGQVQRELERYAIPYTGSGVSGSSTAMHKGTTKEFFKSLGIRTPSHVILSENTEDLYNEVLHIFKTLPGPYIVKPVSGGSSIGVYKANTFEKLLDAVGSVFKLHKYALVEQYIPGVEATCGVIDSFRGEEHYALPPVEIVPDSKYGFFTYDAKYDGSTKELCPASFSKNVKEELQELAKKIHKSLNLRHYSRSDFIISPRGIYALEVNTLPGLTEESLLPQPLAVVGCTLSEFLDHLIDLSLQK